MSIEQQARHLGLQVQHDPDRDRFRFVDSAGLARSWQGKQWLDYAEAVTAVERWTQVLDDELRRRRNEAE
jgi:hypothetical protein